MKEISETIRNQVLQKYCRAIVHMRQELDNMRLGLILGAGISTDFGFPSWGDLIKRIAENPQINAQEITEKSTSHTSISQLLFQQYRSNLLKNVEPEDLAYRRIEMKINAGWKRIVCGALYLEVPDKIQDLKDRDEILWAYLDIIKRIRITVNYNFDDLLEIMLADSRTNEEEKRTRGYKTIWSSAIQLTPDSRVIYHPNGYLPRRLDENSSEQLVFLEDSFADQLIDSMSGHHAFLMNHLSQTTCLLMGLSLNDPTLKHLLRQNAIRHPGHYHYYIAYIESGDANKAMYKQSVSDSNFEVYNLITLFLSKKEIAALGLLLSMDDKEFRHLVEESGGKNIYRYFITGPVSVGKSTMISHFQSLKTHDEWLEPRPLGMEKDPSKVKDNDIKQIDAWVARQIGLKNVGLLEYSTGLHIIDRAPLDAFAFTPRKGWVDKAKFIKKGISPGKANRKLCPGHIILMIGDPSVMASRSIMKHKDTDAKNLEDQQKVLEKVYKNEKQGVNVVDVVDTRDKTVEQVAKEIARIIHCNEYTEANMQEWLNRIEEGTF
jgi:hypothetical protein